MREITLLHPKLQGIVAEFLKRCEAAGLSVKVTETYRTAAEQDALYAQGRETAGKIVTEAKGSSYQSMHQWGVAFDVCRNVKGREYDDYDGFFTRVGEIGKTLDLFWGGDFKSFKDKPHFQMSEFSPDGTTKFLREKYGTPERFMATWEDEDMITQEQFNQMYAKMMADLGAKPPRFTGATGEEFEAAKAAGVTDGTRPQAPATREEVALMAFRAAKKK